MVSCLFKIGFTDLSLAEFLFTCLNTCSLLQVMCSNAVVRFPHYSFFSPVKVFVSIANCKATHGDHDIHFSTRFT